MKVTWRLENTQHQDDTTGELDVDDDATDEEIEAEVREDMWNTMSLTWECEEMEYEALPDIETLLSDVDRIIAEEREACAKMLEAMANMLADSTNNFTNIGTSTHWARAHALTTAAKAIRNRGK